MTRNQKIVATVLKGKTYSEAAAKLGVSRNVVAGVCARAGVKLGDRAISRLRSTQAARRQWADPVKRQAKMEWLTKHFQSERGKAHLKALSEGSRAYIEKRKSGKVSRQQRGMTS